YFFPFSFSSACDNRDLPSFPTRRSSDLNRQKCLFLRGFFYHPIHGMHPKYFYSYSCNLELVLEIHVYLNQSYCNGYIILLSSKLDRKSTRLNSSHVKISYAVFCLKKKKI